MKRQLLLIIFVLLVAVLSADPGDLDPTFGDNGIVIYNYGTGYHDFTNDVHVYEDSSILVCGGYLDNINYNSTGNLQKFLPDGSIDMTWGTNGMVIFQFGVSTVPYTMILLPDGKILVSGVVFFAADAEFFAARFNSDGTTDITFNNTGYWIGSFPDNVEMSCNDMVIQPDGKIILAGRNGITFSSLLFYRLNSDGSPDTEFGTNGYTEIDEAYLNENINGVDILSDGSIVGVGYTHLGDPWYGEFAIMVKLDADGNPYPGFGTNGVLIPAVFDDYSQALACTIVNDAIIISSTFGDPNVSEDFAITKLDQDGNPDPEFGNNGISILDIDQLTYGEDIFYGPDNKFYICGSSGQGGIGAPRDFFLCRYNSDGLIDTDFNENGYVITSIGNAWDHAFALDMGPDGKIVLAGFTAMGQTGDNDRALTRYFTAESGSFISVNMSEIHFGEVITGETAREVFEISNSGDLDLTYDIIFPDWISVTGQTGAIAPGEADEITVEFTPSEAIYYSGIIEITNNSINQPLVEISVDGTGIEMVLEPPADLAVDTYTGLFTWQAPETDDLTGYDVYLDGELQGYTTQLEWLFSDLENGFDHTAGVMAVYDEGNSDLVTIDFYYEGTDTDDQMSMVTKLRGNYPNPFNPETTIRFSTTNSYEKTRIEIFNIKGQKIKTLVNGVLPGGQHSVLWNGTDGSGKPVASGIYYYRLISGKYLEAMNMILMK